MSPKAEHKTASAASTRSEDPSSRARKIKTKTRSAMDAMAQANASKRVEPGQD